MMTLLILGAGTGGTIVANKMAAELDTREWEIIVIDRDQTHHYQPGLLFIPIGTCSPRDVQKPKRDLISRGVKLILSDTELIEPDQNRVTHSDDQQVINYDCLVITPGTQIHPAQTEAMLDVLVRKMLRHMDGQELLPVYDGHASCFIESGFNQGILIDFNYEVESLPGAFPLPFVGPFSLSKESVINHWGRLGFRWVYWNILL